MNSGWLIGGCEIIKKNRILIVGFLMASLMLCTRLQASDLNLTPPPGSSLRKEIMDALRQEVKRIHGLDVVFVVKHLKVKKDWAWTHTLPQSPDGLNRFEDVSALLHLQDGVWKVVEIPCGEIENPDCFNGPEYFFRLKKRFSTIPKEIFPDWTVE